MKSVNNNIYIHGMTTECCGDGIFVIEKFGKRYYGVCSCCGAVIDDNLIFTNELIGINFEHITEMPNDLNGKFSKLDIRKSNW